MLPTLAQIIGWISFYRYWVIFPISILEGPIITVIGGFLSSIGVLNIFIVYPLVVLGDLVGDSLYYSLGYFGKERFIRKWGKYLGLSEEKIFKIEKHFGKHSGKTVFLGKISHGIGLTVLIAAGMTRMNYWKFIFYSFLSAAFQCLIFILIGYYFGHAYERIRLYLDFWALGISILVVLIYIAIRLAAKKASTED